MIPEGGGGVVRKRSDYHMSSCCENNLSAVSGVLKKFMMAREVKSPSFSSDMVAWERAISMPGQAALIDVWPQNSRPRNSFTERPCRQSCKMTWLTKINLFNFRGKRA